MNADSGGSPDASASETAATDPADVHDVVPDPNDAREAGSAASTSDPARDPAVEADDLKAKYRDALAHKHGAHGAAHTQHGDKGANAPGHEQAHAPRMFRRKSG